MRPPARQEASADAQAGVIPSGATGRALSQRLRSRARRRSGRCSWSGAVTTSSWLLEALRSHARADSRRPAQTCLRCRTGISSVTPQALLGAESSHPCGDRFCVVGRLGARYWIGDIPVTRGASCGSVGGALVPERPGRLCIGSRAFLHGALPGRIRWWAGDFGRIGRAGHRRGDVADFVRKQSRAAILREAT